VSRTRGSVGWAPYAVMAALVVVALAVGGSGGEASTDADRVFALSRAIACPQCDGQPVAESQSPVAQEIRADIARRVDAGETDEQIRGYYADTYGQRVLLRPTSEGVAGLVWVLPVASAVAGIAVLAVVSRRWSRRPLPAASETDAELVARALRDGA
jgi:cytochrome c-type biogenesis protein CcmH